jgi:tetratricopeptide (TPR) repeat protein
METSPQLAYWSEQSLALMAVTASQAAKPESSDEFALEAFRTWASTATKSKEVPAAKYGNTRAHSNRILTWRAYYRLVSDVLSQSPTQSIDHSSFARAKQATELRQVEAQYEIELLRTTRFPKATESNEIVEVWVEQVIQNWNILCGPDWHDYDLGTGGRNEVGRNVLDILYRAASKTFHSTLILRRLFQVHKSLTDFDLAYRALDTYIELVERDRARLAKGEGDADGQGEQDGHEVVFQTISEGIEGLCSFGRRSEAKKAYELATKIEEWSNRLSPDSSRAPVVNGHPNGEVDGIMTKKTVLSQETLGLTYRAVGIAEAHWAKWSPFSEHRSSLQAKASSNLARATTLLEGEPQHRAEAAYALAMLLAETREVDQAIECVKAALDSNFAQSEPNPGYAHERKKLPLWHLLALLLTARQDFDTAAQSCNAAFEQFGSVSILLGSGTSKIPIARSMHEKGSRDDISQHGIVDDMECAELQSIVEIRITELALIEVIEGPEDAVNSSNELLALYYRLFGHLDVGTAGPAAPKELAPPPSSSDTIKSFRGSIFGRKKQSARHDNFSVKSNGVKSTPGGRSTRPTTQATNAPTIKITDQDEKEPSPRSHRFRRSEEHSPRDKHASHKLVRREGSINQAIRRRSQERHERKSLTSSHRQSFETSQQESAAQEALHQSHATLDPVSAALKPQHSIDDVPTPPTSLTHDSSPQAKQVLPPVDHALTSHDKAPPSHRHGQKSPDQDVRLPNVQSTITSTSAVPHFPRSAAQKHALTVLVKIWLVIAKLYRRASLFDDSREACDEAAKATQKIESLVASVESSARAFSDAGWGGGKSSDEMWADVFCDRAELALAVAAVQDADATDETGAGVREAVEQFEQCLMYYPNHARGIVGLSNVLLDYSEKKVELGRRVDDGRPKPEAKREVRPSTRRVVSQNGSIGSSGSDTSQQGTSAGEGDELRKTPENLNRLAARDRAYGLLSTLTKLGTGWDDSEAWFALARAHELGGEIDKAKEILWWCVELEDTRPIRHWRNVGCGGYVL